jgi:hypothetical protein
MNDLDTAISKAHSAAEDTENQSRQLEARICKIPGAARYLPSRRYGAAVSASDIAKNLTLVSLLQRHDHQLAAYLGCAGDHHRREQEAIEARKMAAESMEMQTARLREVNAASARYREQQNLAGRNPMTGRRWGS